jgi:hypothetical protein
MVKMPNHEFLIITMVSNVLNIIPHPSSVIAPSGILKSKFGYDLRLAEFEETIYEFMKKKGVKLPDLLLVNENKKLLITVECKSDYTFEIEENLTKQIEFYSSKIYKKICSEMFPTLTNRELWIFSPENFCSEISKLVRNLKSRKNLINTVIWGMRLRKRSEVVQIKKFYGNHLDNELNQIMNKGGFVCSPPRLELLIDPTLSSGKKIYRVGRRIFTFLASSLLNGKDRKERAVTAKSFKKRYKDVIISEKEVKRCLRCLSLLVPEFGEYDSHTGKLILSKKPSLDKLQDKLKKIQTMSDVEIKVILSKIGARPPRGLKRPRASQETKISEFFPKKNVSKIFMPLFKPSFVEKILFLS